MVPSVEFIYDSGCPNVSEARKQLLRAFTKAEVSATWQEWEQSDPNGPDYIERYSSPTILVDGKDVCGAKPNQGISACRIYHHTDGTTSGIPPLEKIVSAIKLQKEPVQKEGKSFFAAFSYFFCGIFALLPKASCPA